MEGCVIVIYLAVCRCQAALLQQQLCLETRARTEAQVRAQHLLQQNGELLQHLSMLIKHIQELELRTHSSSSTSDFFLPLVFFSSHFWHHKSCRKISANSFNFFSNLCLLQWDLKTACWRSLWETTFLVSHPCRSPMWLVWIPLASFQSIRTATRSQSRTGIQARVRRKSKVRGLPQRLAYSALWSFLDSGNLALHPDMSPIRTRVMTGTAGVNEWLRIYALLILISRSLTIWIQFNSSGG